MHDKRGINRGSRLAPLVGLPPKSKIWLPTKNLRLTAAPLPQGLRTVKKLSEENPHRHGRKRPRPGRRARLYASAINPRSRNSASPALSASSVARVEASRAETRVRCWRPSRPSHSSRSTATMRAIASSLPLSEASSGSKKATPDCCSRWSMCPVIVPVWHTPRTRTSAHR